jgi:hypothetical protein
MLSTLRVDAPARIDHPEVQSAISAQIRHFFPEVSGVSFDGAAVILTTDADLDDEKIHDSVRRIVKIIGSIPAGVGTKTVLNPADSGALETWRDNAKFPRGTFRAALDAFAADLRESAAVANKLQRGGQRRILGSAVTAKSLGLNMYGWSAGALMQSLDRFLARCLIHGMDATPLSVPSLVPSRVVHKAGYFETSPQHLSFIAPVTNDADRFDELMGRLSERPDETLRLISSPEVLHYTRDPQYLLNPAVCLHCYEAMEGAVISDPSSVVFTAVGSVFREESGNLNNEERLYEFSMREAVLLGSPEGVEENCAPLFDLLVMVGVMTGLEFEVRTASDMFYRDGARARLMSQLLSDSKVELLVTDPGTGRRIACASLNRHGSHLSIPFNIRVQGGKPAVTACLGFGINRLAHVLGRAYGHDLGAMAEAVAAAGPAVLAGPDGPPAQVEAAD